MCVAIVVPDGAEFPERHKLRLCEVSNPDGAGIAWISEGKVEWMKGLDADEVYDFGSRLTGPKLIHFRFATAGAETEEMTHPFPVEKIPRIDVHGRADTVLIHNGHWSGWEFMARVNQVPAGPWTDTRLMARLIAQTGIEAVNHLKRAGQKLALLQHNGEWATIGDWVTMEDVHYSNDYWDRSYTFPGAPYSTRYDDELDEFDKRWYDKWWEDDRQLYEKPYNTQKKTVVDMNEASLQDDDPEVAACTVRYVNEVGEVIAEHEERLGGWSEISD